MKKSLHEEREIGKFCVNEKVGRAFARSNGHTIIARVTVDDVSGEIRLVRENEQKWLVLSDSIDRTVLFGSSMLKVWLLDIERLYQEFLVDGIIAGDVK